MKVLDDATVNIVTQKPYAPLLNIHAAQKPAHVDAARRPVAASSTRPSSRSCTAAGRARLVIEMLDASLLAHGLIHGLPTEAVDNPCAILCRVCPP